MLDENDIEYISSGFLDVFGIVGETIYYVPLINIAKNKFGEISFNYDENIKIPLTVMFSKSSSGDLDVEKFYTPRKDAEITILNRELDSNNIILKEKDAFDVIGRNETVRYVLTGYLKDPVLIDIFTKVTVTDFETAFERYRKEGI
jgi:hypothetical protein